MCFNLELCMVCLFLEGWGYFGWLGVVGILAVFLRLPAGLQSQSVSHMFIWSLGLQCVPFLVVWNLPVLLLPFLDGWWGHFISVLYSAKVCKLCEVMVVTVIIYCKIEYC